MILTVYHQLQHEHACEAAARAAQTLKHFMHQELEGKVNPPQAAPADEIGK